MQLTRGGPESDLCGAGISGQHCQGLPKSFAKWNAASRARTQDVRTVELLLRSLTSLGWKKFNVRQQKQAPATRLLTQEKLARDCPITSKVSTHHVPSYYYDRQKAGNPPGHSIPISVTLGEGHLYFPPLRCTIVRASK